jgi:hypothetical protein
MAITEISIPKTNWIDDNPIVISFNTDTNKLTVPGYGNFTVKKVLYDMSVIAEPGETYEDVWGESYYVNVFSDEESDDSVPIMSGHYFDKENFFRFEAYDVVRSGKCMYTTISQVIFNIY